MNILGLYFRQKKNHSWLFSDIPSQNIDIFDVTHSTLWAEFIGSTSCKTLISFDFVPINAESLFYIGKTNSRYTAESP